MKGADQPRRTRGAGEPGTVRWFEFGSHGNPKSGQRRITARAARCWAHFVGHTPTKCDHQRITAPGPALVRVCPAYRNKVEPAAGARAYRARTSAPPGENCARRTSQSG